MRLFPKDATSKFEQFVYAAGIIIPVALYLFMVLSAFGIFHNFYQIACARASGAWLFIGAVLTGGMVGSIYYQSKSPDPRSGGILIIVGLAALSLAAYCGFGYPYWL